MRPVPGRYKDYITNPKGNGYRSIHNTFELDGFGEGAQLEVQIRTVVMHEEAERGARQSHMAYDAGTKYTPGRLLMDDDGRGVSLKPYVWRTDAAEVANYTDFFSGTKLVFGGQGNLYEFPQDATLLDFVFATHSEQAMNVSYIYDSTSDAPRTHGALAPAYGYVTYEQSSSIRCRESWLQDVTTKKARKAINRQLREQNKARHFADGIARVSKIYSKELEGVDLGRVIASFGAQDLSNLTSRDGGYGVQSRSVEDLVGLVGTGDLRPGTLAKYVLGVIGLGIESSAKKIHPEKIRSETHILAAIEDVGAPLRRTACCAEDHRGGAALVGYPSRKRAAVMVHFETCVNIAGYQGATVDCTWIEKALT